MQGLGKQLDSMAKAIADLQIGKQGSSNGQNGVNTVAEFTRANNRPLRNNQRNHSDWVCFYCERKGHTYSLCRLRKHHEQKGNLIAGKSTFDEAKAAYYETIDQGVVGRPGAVDIARTSTTCALEGKPADGQDEDENHCPGLKDIGTIAAKEDGVKPEVPQYEVGDANRDRNDNRAWLAPLLIDGQLLLPDPT